MPTRTIILLVILLGVITAALLSWVEVPTRITITVQSSGQVLIEGQVRHPDEIETIIHDYVEDDDQVEIVIVAGASIPVGDVLKIREYALDAGALHIELIAADPSLPNAQ